MRASGARVVWYCLVVSGVLICAQAQDVASKPQAKPQGTQAGAPAAAADTAYLPEERWHRKDLNPNRDQPYGSRDQQYGSRDQQYGGRDQQYGSRDQQYGGRDQQYGSRSGPKTKPYPSAGSGSEPYPAEPYPSYGSGPNGGGGGGSGGQLKPPEFVQEDCIKNIDEFAEAFNRGGVNRCVDDKIIVRLDQWFDFLNVTTKEKLFKNFVQKQARTTTFWSYGDNPEKYIRIGRDVLTLGNFVDNPPANNTGLQNGSFGGLLDFSNFAGLLESIGYSSVDTRPKAGYMMVITYKPTRRIQNSLPLPVYQPTWRNIVTYIQWFISKVAAADDAAGAEAKLDAANYSNFKFDDDTVKILENTTFSDLTGCQAQCTVQDTNFGNPNDATWDAPCLEVRRISSSSCNQTLHIKSNGDEEVLSPASRYEFTEPTAVNAFDDKCSAKFIAYRKNITSSPLCSRGATNSTKNRALALQVAQAYNAAVDPKDKVLVLRSYLLSGCAGSYNALFTGNGFTASGNGGFWQATGTEIHTGEVTPEKLPDAFPRVRVLFFCPYAQDGNPHTHAICPESVGKLNVTSVLRDPAININQAWDVQEVFHPADPSKPSNSEAKGSNRHWKDNRMVNTLGMPSQG